MIASSYILLGLEYVEKQTGHSQSRETNEKVTDKGREFYEKQSGYADHRGPMLHCRAR